MIRYLEDDTIPTNRLDMHSYLHVNSAGHSEESFPLHVLRPTGRKDYHILYNAKGSCRVCKNGVWLPLRAGQAYFFPPNERQEYTKSKGTDTFWVHFSGFGTEGLCNELGLTSSRVVSLDQRVCVEEIFSRLITLFAAKQRFYEIECSALLLQILTALGQNAVQKTASESLVTEVVLQMQKDIHKKFDMEKYANLCCLSVSRFSYVFSKATGVSPYRFFTELKIKQACYLLKNTDEKIKNIAFTLGYDDELHFSVLFKKIKGTSPKSYRNNSKKA